MNRKRKTVTILKMRDGIKDYNRVDSLRLHTHTHTHTNIYIYIYTRLSLSLSLSIYIYIYIYRSIIYKMHSNVSTVILVSHNQPRFLNTYT